MLEWLCIEKHCEVVALCDLDESKIQTAEKQLKNWQKKSPKTYVGDSNTWKKLTKQDNIDLVLVTTPWNAYPYECLCHAKRKTCSCEVPIAYTIEDCWLLTQTTAEQTQRHCIMIENCCL